MPALAITITFSFILGCLTSIGEQRASRVFNKATAGGALLYAIAFVLAFGLSLLAIALIGTALGTYTRANDSVVLASYCAGLAVLTVLNRWRSSRR